MVRWYWYRFLALLYSTMGFLDSIGGAFSGAFGGVKDAFSGGFGGVKDIFSGGFSGVKDIFGGAYRSVVQPVYEGAIKPIFNKGYGMVTHNLDRFENLGDRTVTSAGNLVDGAGNIGKGLGDLFSSPVLLTVLAVGAGLIILPRVLDKVL